MCLHISLHRITTIDHIYLNDIPYYRGDSNSLLDKMTSFIKLIITCKNTKMLKMLQLAQLSPINEKLLRQKET